MIKKLLTQQLYIIVIGTLAFDGWSVILIQPGRVSTTPIHIAGVQNVTASRQWPLYQISIVHYV